ncbi:hypothetical protein ACSBL2_17575 [Pedobacter sp. AW31-3R]|uniref:hypothetical protein n=1 Tax=Pedobacter sp. AW31-3R TaxID=3445781 RepID=UPI003F9F0473
MASSWFTYNKNTPIDRLVGSNYTAVMGNPDCPTPNPVNICAVFATISATQPVLTPNLISYLNAASVYPHLNQPTGAAAKFVLTRQQ